MTDVGKLLEAVQSAEAAPRIKPSNYPEPFASQMAGRVKQPLGDLFGIKSFGVNRTTLPPGTVSALFHAHSVQDEFVLILSGSPTLHHGELVQRLCPGMCVGFKSGTGLGHRLVNESNEDVVYIEVGDRAPGDAVTYPADDLQATMVDGRWAFTHKDGVPYST